MRTAVLVVTMFGAIVGASPAAPVSRPAVPVLVELFTSEGCSSCPPADQLFEQMIASQPAIGTVIVGLGEHVDYWDRLGWKDRFSSSSFTSRQQLYADRLKLDSVYTPQIVVDGQAAFVGSDAGAARRAVAAAAERPHGTIAITIGRAERDRAAISVTVGELPPLTAADRADVLVAVTEDHLRTEVKRGENHGRTLTHAVVVRDLQTAGAATAGATVQLDVKLAGEWHRNALSIVGFVQERRARRILASAATSLPE
jgi:hypothetical protein